MEAVTLVDHMQRPSPDRSDLLREFMVSRFSSNQDAKAQGATSKREKFFSREVLDIIEFVSHCYCYCCCCVKLLRVGTGGVVGCEMSVAV